MDSLLQILSSTLRVSTPLLFAALGGLMSERSGVINIALEGLMLVGAFTGAIVAYSFHSPWLGWGAAAISGVLLAAIYAASVINWKADQIVAGTAINMLALGMVPFISKILYGVTGTSPTIPADERFIFAPIILVWVFLLIIHFWLGRTPSGLWVRFAGEHPKALDAAGIGVKKVRWGAVLMGGALAALGGATLSTMLSSAYARNMTAGRGFMALAALIFGKWRPIPTAMACLLFGFTEALQIRLQGVVLWGTEPVPVQFIQILPYLVTVLVLAGLVGHSRPPKALGLFFEKD
ncbi:ABC transporter permease [bacterium]|nr:ABC transporter permease [bacterium]